MIKTILISAGIGFIIYYVFQRISIWAIPKLQKIHFEKVLELEELKRKYKEQEEQKKKLP